MFGYCWRTYFSTYKAEISAGVLHASGPSEGSWVRRHFGASEFANSIPPFARHDADALRHAGGSGDPLSQNCLSQSTSLRLMSSLSFGTNVWWYSQPAPRGLLPSPPSPTRFGLQNRGQASTDSPWSLYPSSWP